MRFPSLLLGLKLFLRASTLGGYRLLQSLGVIRLLSPLYSQNTQKVDDWPGHPLALSLIWYRGAEITSSGTVPGLGRQCHSVCACTAVEYVDSSGALPSQPPASFLFACTYLACLASHSNVRVPHQKLCLPKIREPMFMFCRTGLCMLLSHSNTISACPLVRVSFLMGSTKIHLLCAPTWCDTQGNAGVVLSFKKCQIILQNKKGRISDHRHRVLKIAVLGRASETAVILHLTGDIRVISCLAQQHSAIPENGLPCWSQSISL